MAPSLKIKPRCKHLLTTKTCAACLGLPRDPSAGVGLEGGHSVGFFVRDLKSIGTLTPFDFIECDGDAPAENAGSIL